MPFAFLAAHWAQVLPDADYADLFSRRVMLPSVYEALAPAEPGGVARFRRI